MTNPVHIKLDYNKSLKSKKYLLSLEANLLNSIKRMRMFHLARKRELRLKTSLRWRLKKLIKDLNQLKKALPTDEFKKTKYVKENILFEETEPETLGKNEENRKKIIDRIRKKQKKTPKRKLRTKKKSGKKRQSKKTVRIDEDLEKELKEITEKLKALNKK